MNLCLKCFIFISEHIVINFIANRPRVCRTLVGNPMEVMQVAPSAHIRYFCENSMIAHSALVMKDTFAPRFASMQLILDSVEFLKNSEVILAKFSSSCVYMLSFS